MKKEMVLSSYLQKLSGSCHGDTESTEKDNNEMIVLLISSTGSL